MRFARCRLRMLERAATPRGLLFLRLRGPVSGRGAKEIFDGTSVSERGGESLAQSGEDEVRMRRMPERVLGGAVRGRSMGSGSVTGRGDNVAIAAASCASRGGSGIRGSVGSEPATGWG